MERRKAITTAAAASLTLLAGAAGIALNSGIVGAGGDGNVGQVSPISATNPPVTLYVDDPAATVDAAPLVQPTASRPVATSAASSSQVDDRGEDDDEYEDGERSEYDSEDHAEYEGGEDDD